MADPRTWDTILHVVRTKHHLDKDLLSESSNTLPGVPKPCWRAGTRCLLSHAHASQRQRHVTFDTWGWNPVTLSSFTNLSH